LQWPLAVAVVVSRESRDEKAELVRNCPSENKDVKIRSLAFYSSEFVRKITVAVVMVETSVMATRRNDVVFNIIIL